MTLSGPDQLWVADITYIRLACEFVYLAVVLDVFSRKVIGWALGRSLKAQLPICALERAIANRKLHPRKSLPLGSGRAICMQPVHMQKLWEHGIAAQYETQTCESRMTTPRARAF